MSSNSPRYLNFHAFRVLSKYGNFPSAYYQNTEIFIPPIISIRTISFRVLSANAKFFLKWKIHSAYSQYKLNSFLVFSLYAKFHSPYSFYEFNFFPCIIDKRTTSFNVLSANAKFFWDQSLIPRIIRVRLISFRVLLVKAKFHSTYYQHTLNFIPRIRWQRQKKFKDLEWNFSLHSF